MGEQMNKIKRHLYKDIAESEKGIKEDKELLAYMKKHKNKANVSGYDKMSKEDKDNIDLDYAYNKKKQMATEYYHV